MTRLVHYVVAAFFVPFATVEWTSALVDVAILVVLLGTSWLSGLS